MIFYFVVVSTCIFLVLDLLSIGFIRENIDFRDAKSTMWFTLLAVFLAFMIGCGMYLSYEQRPCALRSVCTLEKE